MLIGCVVQVIDLKSTTAADLVSLEEVLEKLVRLKLADNSNETSN
jgi:hypothetical protein